MPLYFNIHSPTILICHFNVCFCMILWLLFLSLCICFMLPVSNQEPLSIVLLLMCKEFHVAGCSYYVVVFTAWIPSVYDCFIAALGIHYVKER